MAAACQLPAGERRPVPVYAVLGNHDYPTPGSVERERDSVPLLDTLAYGATRRTGIVERGYKLILSFSDGAWRARLYRRGREGADLAAPAPQLAAQLRESLVAHQERGERDARAETAQELDARERAALEALGYAAGDGR